MQYEFLKAFPKRMKNVGLYALLFMNSSQKAIWKQFGFDDLADQLNMIFAVLLYIMEQTLKREPCMIDDISAFIDSINSEYFQKSMTYEDCYELGYYIINNILSNEGKPMYFRGYDFENMSQKSLHISYVANKSIYPEQDVKRVSYEVTDDGYSLLLGTLEVENNMRLPIQELIFQMHMDRQNYDKALDDIKNLFAIIRMQIQKIHEDMGRIRRNVLSYNVADYEAIQKEDMDTLAQTRDKFNSYKINTQERIRELENAQIDVRTLTSEEEDKLKNLREIDAYLGRTIDEHQKILSLHFDLKALYTEELEKISEMSLVRRFDFQTELFDKILENPESVSRLDAFLHPLFTRDIDRILNLNKMFEAQKVTTVDEEEDSTEEVDFDEEAWKEEQERLKKEKLRKYENSMKALLRPVMQNNKVKLSAIGAGLSDEDERAQLIPDINIFKEIMVELLRAREIDIEALRKERAEFIQEESDDFRLNDMLLKILDENPEWKNVSKLTAKKIPGAEPVMFEKVRDESGNLRTIRCSDVKISVIGSEQRDAR